MNKVRFWVSFLLILIFSAAIYQFAFEDRIYRSVGKIKRNYIELGSVVITGFLGFIYYYKPRFKIFKILWMFIYVTSTFFLLVIAIVDNYIYPFSTIEQYRFTGLKQFLISPILFIFFYVFGIISFKSKNPLKE